MRKEKSIKETKEELMETYRKHLDDIFEKGTFNLTFDEREQLISGKFKKETTRVLEKHIEKDPQGVSKNKEPEETTLCHCGTEATLCRDENGNLKVSEREIKTKSGPVKIKEYGYYCSKERKVFFPSPKNT